MYHLRTVVAVVSVALLLVGAVAPAAGGHADHGSDASTADCSFPVTRTDATGTEVTLSEPPERIATLNPSAAQTLWEIGARDRVVGVSEFAGYLEGTDSLPTVNTAAGGIQSERLIELNPDLVIAPGTISADAVSTLRDRGLTVFALDSPSSIEGVADDTTLLGRLTGECAGAAETNAWMRANVEAVRDAVADEPRPTAMYAFSDGWTVGGDTFIGDVLTTAGTRNVVGERVSGYAQVSDEVVRDSDPEWIVYNDRDGIPDAAAYRETTAVREGQTVEVGVNYLNQPAPRSIVRAVRAVATGVHPGAVDGSSYVPREAVDATADPTEDPATPTSATATETLTATTSGDGPGFGVGVAALAAALLLFVAATRRRPGR